MHTSHARATYALAAFTLAWACSGCILANLTPQARFSESAHMLTEAGRWNHVDMALPLLSAKYTAKYLDRHRDWGGAVNIADAELVRTTISEDRATAMSEVAISWYAANSVTVRQSIITQRWVSERGNFRLVDELVRQGDVTVFALPVEPPSGS
jgi:hypothetical protein